MCFLCYYCTYQGPFKYYSGPLTPLSIIGKSICYKCFRSLVKLNARFCEYNKHISVQVILTVRQNVRNLRKLKIT